MNEAAPRLSALILDMDGTLTRVKSPWQYVHERLGLWQNRGDLLLRRYLSGELGYVDFCNSEVAMWRSENIGHSVVASILDEIEIPDVAVQFVRKMYDRGVHLAIVSTGFTRTAERIMQMAGICDGKVAVFANELVADAGGGPQVYLRVGDGTDGPPGKDTLTAGFLQAVGALAIEAGAVGDSRFDEPMFKECGRHRLVRGPDDLAGIQW